MFKKTQENSKRGNETKSSFRSVQQQKNTLKLHSPLDKCATCFGLNTEEIWDSTIIAPICIKILKYKSSAFDTRTGETMGHSWRQGSYTSKNCLFVRLCCIKSTFPNYCFDEHIAENLYTVLCHHQDRFPTRSRHTKWNRTNVLSQDCFWFLGAE
jgi:hypothetical protein